MATVTNLKTKKGRRAATRSLINSIVLTQGNIFIRELLRRKSLPIGTSKEDFETNLLQAVNDDNLQLDDITQWLEEVEGWGDQNVYLCRLPQSIAGRADWRSSEAIRSKLPAAQRKLWNAQSFSFPKTWELTRISYDNRILTYVWHKEYPTLLRRPNMDRQELIDGDQYQFRAYLLRPDRSVMRFVLRTDQALAAVFMQIPAEGDAHENALTMVRETSEHLIDWEKLKPFDASSTIKNLSQADLEQEAVDVKSRKARLTAADAYVEFGTTLQDGDFPDSTPVRHVRRAVQLGRFAGNNAIFGYTAHTPTGLARTVTIEIYGEQRRIKLRAQLKSDEVWSILDLLGGFEDGKPTS